MSSEAKNNKRAKKPKSKPFPFLDGDFWDDESLPTDLAENHDKYLYCLSNVHGISSKKDSLDESSGGWKGLIDGEEFKKQVYKNRSKGNRNRSKALKALLNFKPLKGTNPKSTVEILREIRDNE